MENNELYEKLYHMMFNKVTDIVEELKKVQQDAEDFYVENCEEDEK